jgi:hypothetical protein
MSAGPQISWDEQPSTNAPQVQWDEEKKPAPKTFWQKGLEGLSRKLPGNYSEVPEGAGLTGVSTATGELAQSAEKRRDAAEVANLSNAAKAPSRTSGVAGMFSPPPENTPNRPSPQPSAFYDLASRALRTISGATSPTSQAIAAGGAVAPEIVGPALAAHGLYNAGKNAPEALKGNPEAAEASLGGLSEAAGGGALTGGALTTKPTVGESLGNTTTAKVAQPIANLAKTAVKTAAEPYTIGMTGESMLKKGLAPYAKQTGYDPAVKQASDAILNYHKDTPIKSVRDLHDAIPEIQDKIANEVMNPAGERHATENLPEQRLANVKQAAQESLSPFARKVGREIPPDVSDFLKDLDKAHTIEDLIGKSAGDRGGALGEVNAKLDSYFAKYPSARRADLMKNPETAGWEAIRRSLRGEVMGYLEDQGETGVRDARKTWGALEELGKTTERRVNVNDRSKPMSLARILGLAGAPVTGGLSVVAGEVAHHLNKPDVLVRRGIERMSKQAVQTAQPQRATPTATPQVPEATPRIPARGTPERRVAENRVIGDAMIDQLHGDLRKARTPEDKARIQRNISDLMEQRTMQLGMPKTQ